MRPSVEWEVSLYHACALIVVVFLLRTTFGGSPQDTTATTGRKSVVIGGVRREAARVIGGLRTGFWSYKTARTPEKHKCFEHMLHRRECATT